MANQPQENLDRLMAVYVEAAVAQLPYDEASLQTALRVDLLESAISSVFQGYYTDVETRAGRLLIGLIKNHPLPDGNKRCAWITVRYYLKTEGYALIPDIYRAYDVLLAVADGQISDEKVIAWVYEDLVDEVEPYLAEGDDQEA